MKICERCGALNIRITPVAPSCHQCGAALPKGGTIHAPGGVPVAAPNIQTELEHGTGTLPPGCAITRTGYKE